MTDTTSTTGGVKPGEVERIVNLVEQSSIKDINSILNRATEMFSKAQIKHDDYLEILTRIAKRADTLAQKIYEKTHSGDIPQTLDLEEYRTLYDIARECRDGVREITINKNLIQKLLPDKSVTGKIPTS